MAKIYDHKNRYVLKIRDKNLLYIILAMAILIVIIVKISNSNWSSISLSSAILLIFTVKFIDLISNKKFSNYWKAKRGLKGEDIILKKLKELPDSFSVYHGLRFQGHGDIDFTVVGPTGIFTIEVKSHSGQIDFDGEELTNNGKRFKEKNFLHQAFGEAIILRDYLNRENRHDFFVIPVLVFTGYNSLRFGQNKIQNVYVIHTELLLELINGQREINPATLMAAEKTLAALK